MKSYSGLHRSCNNKILFLRTTIPTSYLCCLDWHLALSCWCPAIFMRPNLQLWKSQWHLLQKNTNVSISWGAIHSTKIQTGPTGKRGPPQKVDLFFQNFSGWTEPIHWVLDWNFWKFWLNWSRPWRLYFSGPGCSNIGDHYPLDKSPASG